MSFDYYLEVSRFQDLKPIVSSLTLFHFGNWIKNAGFQFALFQWDDMMSNNHCRDRLHLRIDNLNVLPAPNRTLRHRSLARQLNF